MRTKADTRLIVERLKKEYPVSECSLAYDDAWQLLVSVRLSAQCTDARVNIVTKDLFAKYPTLEALAAAGPDAIEAIIKPCGLGKSKARDLAGMANMLLREYGGKVPQAMEDLLRLPGVGRKSANLIRGDIFHLELKKVSGIIPAVNQIECHPLCYPRELIDYCQENGIQVQAYAPLARGAYLDHDVLCVLGTKYAHTPAQVGLRWAVQKGISVIPKSTNPERIESNARIFDFTIDQEDMDLLDTLNQDYHSASVPEDLRGISL